MITIALYNIKGGVGKTAGAANLAYLAAEEGKKTLIWDLDPQGSSSFYFKTDAKLKGGIKKLLQGDSGAEGFIQATEFENLSVLPADFNNRHLDVLIQETKQAKKKLRNLLTGLQNDFDYVFLDCPPGIGPLSEAVFSVSDVVLMPSLPTTLSLRTWEMVVAFFEEQGIATEKLLSYFNMADLRKNMHNEVIVKYQRNKHFLKSYIPYLSTVEKMGVYLAPVAWFAPSSYAAQCYRELWKELKRKMN